MRQIEDALKGVHFLAIDTAPIIYFIEKHPQFDAIVTEIFRRVSEGELTACTSSVTLCEVLVLPLRQGDLGLRQSYEDLLLNSRNFDTLSISPSAASHAAELRARHNLRTPNALQIAVALEAGCEAFLTNDLDLRRVGDLQVLVVSELKL